MKKLLPLLLSTCILVAGCGSGDSFNPSPELQAAADCAGLSLEELFIIYSNVIELLDEIGDGVIPSNMTYTIATGVYTMNLPLGDVTGVVSSPFNLNDGFGIGESATVSWELNGGLAGVGVTGEGSLSFARATATRFTASGFGGFLDSTCEFDFSSLNFTVEAAVSTTPVGSIAFEAITADGTLDGTITFNGSPTARIVATFDGVSYAFFIDLVTFEPIF